MCQANLVQQIIIVNIRVACNVVNRFRRKILLDCSNDFPIFDYSTVSETFQESLCMDTIILREKVRQVSHV